MRELYDTAALRAALMDARDYTLHLYAHLTPVQMRFPYLPTVNPPLWELAHVAWFQEHWCLRWRDNGEMPPARLPDVDPILNSALIAHEARWDLPQLTVEVVHAYLEREFHDTLEQLERTPVDRLYFFLLSLYHEDMHGEALLMSLQTLGYPAPDLGRAVLPRPAAVALRGPREIEFAGGRVSIGLEAGSGFRVRQREVGARSGDRAPSPCRRPPSPTPNSPRSSKPAATRIGGCGPTRAGAGGLRTTLVARDTGSGTGAAGWCGASTAGSGSNLTTP